MSAVDPVGAAPEARTPRFFWLMFGAAAAPLFWLGQLLLGYGVTAYVCYPGDHPLTMSETGPLFTALVALDVVALLACAAGAIVSWRSWQWGRSTDSKTFTSNLAEGRTRFLAVWGLMSCLWFFVAILFNAIASVTVPPCLS